MFGFLFSSHNFFVSEAKTVVPLKLHGMNGGAVKLNWEQPTAASLPGKLLEYRVDYRAEGSERISEVKIPYVIQDYTVHDLIPGQTYYFRVIPKTRAGYPKSTPDLRYPWTSIEVLSDNSSLLPAPELVVSPLNSTTVLVSWSVVEGKLPKAFKLKYQLQTGPDGPSEEMTVDGKLKETLISGLGRLRY